MQQTFVPRSAGTTLRWIYALRDGSCCAQGSRWTTPEQDLYGLRTCTDSSLARQKSRAFPATHLDSCDFKQVEARLIAAGSTLEFYENRRPQHH